MYVTQKRFPSFRSRLNRYEQFSVSIGNWIIKVRTLNEGLFIKFSSFFYVHDKYRYNKHYSSFIFVYDTRFYLFTNLLILYKHIVSQHFCKCYFYTDTPCSYDWTFITILFSISCLNIYVTNFNTFLIRKPILIISTPFKLHQYNMS